MITAIRLLLNATIAKWEKRWEPKYIFDAMLPTSGNVILLVSAKVKLGVESRL